VVKEGLKVAFHFSYFNAPSWRKKKKEEKGRKTSARAISTRCCCRKERGKAPVAEIIEPPRRNALRERGKKKKEAMCFGHRHVWKHSIAYGKEARRTSFPTASSR